jgi:hypothetical protein
VVEGESFSSPPEEPVERRSSSWLGAIAWFLCGLAVAAASAWLSRGLWIAPPVVIAPHTLTAGPGGTYSSITEALEQARAGDTVEVLLGDYREQVRLKSGVTLRSRPPHEAKILAAPLSKGPAVIAQNVKGAVFSGFHIVGDTQAPLSAGVLLENSQVEVDDVEIEGASVGIEIRGGDGVALLASDIHDCPTAGALILGPGAPWISHNTFRRNKAAGLTARGEARPALMGNVFDQNALDLPPEIPLGPVRERNTIPDTGKAGRRK